MQFAFSTHACNDWRLEWQGVRKKLKVKTVMCVTAGAVESHGCDVRYWTTEAFILFICLFFLTVRQRGKVQKQSDCRQEQGDKGEVALNTSHFLQEVAYSWTEQQAGRGTWMTGSAGWLVSWRGKLEGGCGVCCVLMLMTSPGFWSAVVLCLCCWAAGERHWGWGLSVWAAKNNFVVKTEIM